MSNSTQDSVALLSWSGEPDRIIQDVDGVLEDREDSTNQLRATTTLFEADGVEDEQELIFQNRRFIVAEVLRDRHADRATIVADEAQAELAGHVLKDFEFNSWTAFQALEHALRNTRWTPGEVANVRYGRAQFEDLTVLEACHFLANHQDAYVTFDSLRRRVNLVANRGVTHERVFTYGRELDNIEKTSRQPVTTVIYPTGADDMTIASVNGGLDYVEDYGYYTSRGLSLNTARGWYRKEDYWHDSRYEIPENLKRDAQKRLAEEAYPAITYTLTAQATAATDGTEDDLDLTGIGLGDRVYVWDDEIDTKLVAEVSAVTTSSDQSRNELVLSSLPESFGGPSTGGRRGSGRFFGDSGSTAGSAVFPRSGFQPRPSMPVLENITDVGVGTVRWNGQDHNGEYESIPVRFGSVIPRVGKVADDGTVPSPESDHVYEGTRIVSRGGGVATVAFGEPGQYAVWFYMLGSDQKAQSEYSDVLIVDVEALVNVEDIDAGLSATQDRLDAYRDEVAQPRFEQLEEGLGTLGKNVKTAERLSEAALDLLGLDDRVHVSEEQPEAPPADDPHTAGIWVNPGNEERRVYNHDTGQWDLVTERGLFEAVVAKQATIINAAMQNLTVTERADFVAAFADELYADEFTARVATLARVVISGQAEELWPDPLFQEPGEYDRTDQLIRALNGMISGTSPGDGTSYLRWATSFPISVLPGEQYALSAEFAFTDAGPSSPVERGPEVRVRALNAAGGIVGSQFGERTLVHSGMSRGFRVVEGTYTVPDDPQVASIQIGFGTGFDTPEGQGFFIRDLSVLHAIYDGRLIVDGTVDTRHLNVTENMTAALLNAKKVEADDIEANAIDGMTITGGIISGGRVEGGVVQGSQITNGDKFLVEEDGTMRASGAVVDGDITGRRMALEGELRVGLNGEGGLTPDNGLLRIRGRLPSNTGASRDMFVTGETAQFSQWVDTTLTSGQRHDIVYPEPKPWSTTRVLATDSGFSSAVNMNISVGQQSASGFSAIAMASTAPGRDLTARINYAYRISYVAYWRQ